MKKINSGLKAFQDTPYIGIARYEADAYCPKEPPYQMWNQYDLRQRSYFMYYSGCHGDLVTITTRYAADAYLSKESPYQIWTQCN